MTTPSTGTPDTRLRHELASVAVAVFKLARSPDPLDRDRLGDLFHRFAIAFGEAMTTHHHTPTE